MKTKKLLFVGRDFRFASFLKYPVPSVLANGRRAYEVFIQVIAPQLSVSSLKDDENIRSRTIRSFFFFHFRSVRAKKQKGKKAEKRKKVLWEGGSKPPLM